MLNRNELELLQQMRSMPSVTITLPTHRTAPDNQQDPIRLKNLATEAANRLSNDFSKRELEPILTRLKELVENVDHAYNEAGMALFVNRDFSRLVKLPFTLPERVEVNEGFATRDMVYAMNRTRSYWVLHLSEQHTRLHRATDGSLTEVREGGFPMEVDPPSKTEITRREQKSERFGDIDEGHDRFFRKVDGAYDQVNKREKLPLAVVGVERYLSMFRDVSTENDVVAEVRGNYEHLNEHELGQLVWPAVREGFMQRHEHVFSRLDAAIGARKIASTIGEVWRHAHEGRGELIIVEENYHEPATIDESGMHLTPADSVEPLDVVDDAVDEAIETVLQMKGEVAFVPDGSLEKHGRIALVLRY
jgi:hypothetical protein